LLHSYSILAAEAEPTAAAVVAEVAVVELGVNKQVRFLGRIR
jgi:hypothetical protein